MMSSTGFHCATATGKHPHRLTDVAQIREFMLAGNARFTLVSKKTGTRFTYRVRLPQTNEGANQANRYDKPHFVQALTGPDNELSYQFFGTIFNRAEFRHGRRSRISWEAPIAGAFTWFWQRLGHGIMPDALEFWHEGRCGRCGRALTVPESIAAGIGPECAQHVMPRLNLDGEQLELRT
jgi:hypothetical protein